jgi:hypothetical protein
LLDLDQSLVLLDLRYYREPMVLDHASLDLQLVLLDRRPVLLGQLLLCCSLTSWA